MMKLFEMYNDFASSFAILVFDNWAIYVAICAVLSLILCLLMNTILEKYAYVGMLIFMGCISIECAIEILIIHDEIRICLGTGGLVGIVIGFMIGIFLVITYNVFFKKDKE